MELTEQQFEFMAWIMRSHGRSRDACKRVLVYDERQCDVARSMDIDPALIAVSVKKYRTAVQRMRAVF